VGTIGLADHDHVRLSNLQRQIIHSMEGLNRSKVAGAARTLSALNPEIKVETIEKTIDEHNAMEELGRYDVIVDGTDSFRARYLLSDAAYLLRKPLVHGSIFRIEGQVTVFIPGRGCYRCLYPEPPPAGAIEESEDVGVFAALPGIIGTVQAAETIKLITGVGDGLVNRVLLHDTMAMTFREVRYRRNRACPVCGDRPTVQSLVDYDAFVGVEAHS
jgi:adenylyltransferase/sulfurtransferase